MANTKIDSIKLSGSTEIYDIDLPSTATPSIAGLTTSGLSVNGNLIVNAASDGANYINLIGTTSATLSSNITTIQGTNSVNIKSNGPVFIGSENTFANVCDGLIELSNNTGGIKLNSQSTLIMKSGYNIRLSASGGSVECKLPASFSTTATNNIISLETSDFLDRKSPCISLTNYLAASTSVNGKIGITDHNGIGLLKIFNGSNGTNTYLTVSDNCVNMGVADIGGYEYTDFVYFGEKFFDITLSQNLLYDGADPFMRINGTLSNFTLEFPSDQTNITIDPHNLVINNITPKITTSQGELIAYPGCGYTSTDMYTIPSNSDLKSWWVGSQGIAALTSSTLSVSSYTLSSGTNGCAYHIFGFEKGNTSQNPGELRVSTSNTSHTDKETIIVAGNDNGYHGNSYISLTVIVPAGQTYYLWGKNIGDIRSFKVYL